MTDSWTFAGRPSAGGAGVGPFAQAIIPIMIIYFLLQKYIIRGFASGLRG